MERLATPFGHDCFKYRRHKSKFGIEHNKNNG